MKNKKTILSFLLFFVMLLSGCTPWNVNRGELRQETEVIQADGAETVVVHLRMGAGELSVGAGTEALAEAEFIYNNPDWKPVIDYSVSGGEGELWIEQPRKIELGSYRYEWDVLLNSQIPMRLDIGLGAGQNMIDLSELMVTQLEMDIGAGNVELDLTGERARDLDISLRGGIGEVTVLLPAEVGVRAEVAGGIGEVNPEGLSRQEGAYINDAFGDSDAAIHLDIEGGIGRINLRVVE